MRRAILAAVAGLVLTLGAAVGWQHQRLADLRGQLTTAQANAIASQWEASAERATVTLITRHVDRIRVVHDTTTQLQRDTPTYVTPSMDHDYPLPVGFIRVHDAAAAGTLPGPAGAIDATRAPVAASTAAAVIAGNYGTCHETAEQLTALQDWWRAQQALRDAPP
jgi:hypothetical protein